MELPTISCYGRYSNDNYGVNAMHVRVAGFSVYFSYRTPVAFYHYKWGLVVHKNIWGPTTGKHLNWIDGGCHDDRVSSEKFRRLWDDQMDFLETEEK